MTKELGQRGCLQFLSHSSSCEYIWGFLKRGVGARAGVDFSTHILFYSYFIH